MIHVSVSWSYSGSKHFFDLVLPEQATIRQLKQELMHKTRIQPEKQKILGLKPKSQFTSVVKSCSDDSRLTLSMFQAKSLSGTTAQNHVRKADRELKLQLVGTPESDIHMAQQRETAQSNNHSRSPTAVVPPKKKVLTPSECLAQVETEVNQVENQVFQLKTEIEDHGSAVVAEQEQKIRRQLIMYDEMLTQKMIQLDGLENLEEHLRLQRKKLLSQIQSIQSQIDQLKR